jgi:hypothetical protein
MVQVIVYSTYKEIISWLGTQDHKDPRAWCIIERYKHESVSDSLLLFSCSCFQNIAMVPVSSDPHLSI